MKRILLFHVLLTGVVLFVLWYAMFPNFLWSLEGNSFFTTASDFTNFQLSMPADWAKYVGAFLLQFFRYHEGGALLQMLFALIILIASDCIIWLIGRNEHLLWLSFFSLVWFVGGQFQDEDLERSVWWCSGFILVALLVYAFSYVRKRRTKVEVKHWLASPFLNYLFPCLAVGISVFLLIGREEHQEVEKICRLDHWIEDKEWEKVLQSIRPEDAQQSLLQQHWALLALSQIGELSERMFAYGPTGTDSFFYSMEDGLFREYFNTSFYECLGSDNGVVHSAFQAATQTRYGMSFRALRTLIKANIRLGNTEVAEKYLVLLQHSTCHARWGEAQRKKIADQSRLEKHVSNKSIGRLLQGSRSFVVEMAAVVDHYPEDRKALEYLLCGLLLQKDLDKFAYVLHEYAFRFMNRLPRHYEEALLVVGMKHPEVLEVFSVDKTKIEQFERFYSMLQKRDEYKWMLESQFGDSFWFYYYCT